MTHLTVSVVIPTFNRAHLLARAVGCALTECQSGDEVIVVDDGSTDNTEAVVRAFAPAVRYVRTDHRGAGTARNTGVQRAQGDLVAFLDSDDEWIPGKLAWQRTVLEQFPDILFVFSDFGVVTEQGCRVSHYLSSWYGNASAPDRVLSRTTDSTTIRDLPASAPDFRLHIGRLYEAYINGWYVNTCTVVVRRREAGDALRFPEDIAIYEDWECFARLARRGLAGYMDCDTAWQHGHADARLTGLAASTRAEAALTIIERVWGQDEEFLNLHRNDYEHAADHFRLQKVRQLLGQGQRRHARSELARLFHVPRSYHVLSYVPGSLMRTSARLRRRAHGLHVSTRSSP